MADAPTSRHDRTMASVPHDQQADVSNLPKSCIRFRLHQQHAPFAADPPNGQQVRPSAASNQSAPFTAW
ncbi:hypothetical protein ACLOJK_037680 [Asimina triloba]